MPQHQWTAQVIAAPSDSPAAAPSDSPGPGILLRTGFTVRGPVCSARMLITALGVYETELNGTVVGDVVLAPGWTSYHHRHRYHTFDVTGLLRPGPNAWGAHLADGWYRGLLGFNGGTRNLYGSRTGLFAELHITYADGTTQTVTTGPGWRAGSGPVVVTGLYEGESYDARLEQSGWSAPGFDDSAWMPVQVLGGFDSSVLFPADSPPVRRVDEFGPVCVSRNDQGRTVVDFGQNLVGRLRIRVRGEAGHTVTLRHAEVLENGTPSARSLGGAEATDRYVLRGDAEAEEWEPRFTFHGFRYAELEGWPGELGLGDIAAVVLHSDLRRTGWFACSDPSLERLHENVVWSMRGNFLDVPTDCPQRDERLGWTGDAQVFAPTAAFLYDVRDFLASWLRDLAAEQAADEGGVPPLMSPAVPLRFQSSPPPSSNRPMAGWGDATVVVPWTLYERYGDAEVLRAQYPSMRGWVDTVDAVAGPGHVWGEGFQFGDWLDPTAPPSMPPKSSTSGPLVATAYFAHSARLLARTAEVLEEKDDAVRYHALADAVREAFRDRFHRGGGLLHEETQTAYALALCFRLIDDAAERARAGEQLAALVAARGHRIGTGFLGTPLICDALTDTGHADTAYLLLTQRECPSWLYQVDRGATTIWERWDAVLPDGSLNPSPLNSLNHYSYGAVADWLHRTVAGLAPAEPGYRRIRFRPLPGGGITWADAAHETPYGRAESSWRIANGELRLDVLVPDGATATVELPGSAPAEAGPGGHTFRTPWPTTAEDLR
ncbi:glycoside hydrolase family 78 protein [Streptomyces guryensis]|uniref:alpha-L-rhamnosidase n=1 Tax=Streptomyces guryensis TaxID=2886947 RepID=A0A9Q3VTR5_9ACTN|nr:glycoside hydrolase family 78 protein [Streptomyces guryensis]MCD9878454.1 glycoside hydrolase family 78 protein [Streptomyces guryensis]